MTSFSTFAELSAFLLLYVARVDGTAHFLEDDALAEHMKGFTDDSEALLKFTSKAFPKIQDEKLEAVLAENENLIRSTSSEERHKLIASLFAIVNSDGKVQSEETAALRVIRGFLGNTQVN